MVQATPLQWYKPDRNEGEIVFSVLDQSIQLIHVFQRMKYCCIVTKCWYHSIEKEGVA